MKQPSLKYRLINALIMNIPIALSICLTAQLLNNHRIDPKLTLINFILAYIISDIIGVLVPLVPWGVAFALKCKAKPDTLKFGLLINVVVNFGYVLVNAILLTYFNACVLGGAPVIPVLFIGVAASFIPCYIVGYIVSFLWNQPAEKITKSICKE